MQKKSFFQRFFEVLDKIMTARSRFLHRKAKKDTVQIGVIL